MQLDWLALLTAFGVGSIVSVTIQWWLENVKIRNQRLYSERKDAYIGLIGAWVRQEDGGFTQQSERDVGHWLLRAQFVASGPVYAALMNWEKTRPNSAARIAATIELKALMRRDLSR